MFALLGCLLTPIEINKMELTVKYYDGVPVFIPTSRIEIAEKLMHGKIISIKGSAGPINRLNATFFSVNKSLEENSRTQDKYDAEGCYDLRQIPHYKISACISWPKQRKEHTTLEENVHGSIETGVSYSQKDGFHGHVKVEVKFSKEESDKVETIYLTEVVTPNYVIYLPTYTKNKFDNLVNQINNNKATLSE